MVLVSKDSVIGRAEAAAAGTMCLVLISLEVLYVGSVQSHCNDKTVDRCLGPSN